MAAMLDLRVFKLGLLVAGIVLMLSAVGVMVFGSRLGVIPANAVPILSITVWLACIFSAIRRWSRSKRGVAHRTATYEMALSGEAWMLNPATRRLTSQISEPPGSTLYGLVVGEAAWVGPIQLVRLHEQDGTVPSVRTLDPGILPIAIGTFTKPPSAS